MAVPLARDEMWHGWGRLQGSGYYNPGGLLLVPSSLDDWLGAGVWSTSFGVLWRELGLSEVYDDCDASRTASLPTIRRWWWGCPARARSAGLPAIQRPSGCWRPTSIPTTTPSAPSSVVIRGVEAVRARVAAVPEGRSARARAHGAGRHQNAGQRPQPQADELRSHQAGERQAGG